jgi:hypothetical protein
MSVVIHALLFAWYLVGNFFIFLKHRGFGDFPITIGNFLILVFGSTHSRQSQAAVRKQYTHAQSTKSSFQILKKLSMWENVAS